MKIIAIQPDKHKKSSMQYYFHNVLTRETTGVVIPYNFDRCDRIAKLEIIKTELNNKKWCLSEIVAIVPTFEFQVKYIYLGGTLFGQLAETDIISESRLFIDDFIQQQHMNGFYISEEEDDSLTLQEPLTLQEQVEEECDHEHYSWKNNLFECTSCGNLRNILNESFLVKHEMK